MKLTVLGSSSAGNCYLFEGADGVIALEAGIDIREVKKALKWDVSRLKACFVSHRHGDHAAHVKEFLSLGVKVYALPDVFDGARVKNRVFCKEIAPQRGYIVGDWRVIALRVVHDVPCVGFVLEHPEMGKTLFVTDTMMLEWRVKGVNHFLLECNYADDILERNIESGAIIPSMRERLLGSHMELETTKGILSACDRSELQDVVLIHLSDGNSNAARFKREIEAVAGVPTYIADTGLTVDLSLVPY